MAWINKRPTTGTIWKHSSMNWSGEGVLRNRDAGVIIENATAAQYYTNIFLDDWNRHAVKNGDVLACATASP